MSYAPGVPVRCLPLLRLEGLWCLLMEVFLDEARHLGSLYCLDPYSCSSRICDCLHSTPLKTIGGDYGFRHPHRFRVDGVDVRVVEYYCWEHPQLKSLTKRALEIVLHKKSQ